MKILLISPFTSISGSAIRFWNIAHQMQLRGFKVVYVERAPKNSPRPLFDNIVYYRSPRLSNLYVDIAVSLVYNLIVLLKHFDCSIYYALKPAPNNCIPALVAKVCGKRIFLDIDDLDFGYFHPGLKKSISSFFFKAFPGYFEIITCHTENLKQYLLNTLKIPQKQIYFLSQGVSDLILKFDQPLDTLPDNKSIIYIATLGITTDFEDLLPMFSRISLLYKDLKINIIGDGIKKAFFEKKVHEMGIAENVIFLGRIEHKDVPGIMIQNRIGLNYMRPSFTNNCRSILKIREYLTVGLEVVCNNVGDAEVFRGYIYMQSTIEDIEKKLIEILAREPIFNAGGKEFVRRNFNWDTIVGDFIDYAMH